MSQYLSLKHLSEIEAILNGAQLTTAHITYHLPDHLSLLQFYIWQDYDFSPYFPRLESFISFWHENIEGPIQSVEVYTTPPLCMPNLSKVSHVFQLQ